MHTLLAPHRPYRSRPVSGKLLSLSGLGVDVLQDAAAAAITIACSWLGLGSVRSLPPSVLHALARLLPTGLVQALGLPPASKHIF